MTAQRALIVGAGLGGLRAAESLRANGYAGEIVVVGDEPHPPYSRPPLSKEALADEPSFDRLAFRIRAAAADVVWRLGVRAEHADLDAREVVLAGGEVVAYDALVAATGVSARRLPIPGPPPNAAGGRHVVRTLDDAVALRSALVPGTRVVILGAGFIGCEVAATARTLGCEVHAVALDERPMIRPLGPVLAAELQRRHEAHGVAFHLGVAVSAFVGEDRVEGVVLTDETRLAADVVVEALGSRPNTDLLEGNGLDLSDGVLTDAALRPLRGDARSTGWPWSETSRGSPTGASTTGPGGSSTGASPPTPAGAPEPCWRPTWPAAATGRSVDAYWDLLPAFWSDQYDIRLQSYGMPGLADPDGIRVLEGALDDECVVGYHRGGELVGVVGVGMLRAVNAYRATVGHPRPGG